MSNPDTGFYCPRPWPAGERILLAHGGGGRLMQQLIQELIQPIFASPLLSESHDGARLPLQELLNQTPLGQLAFSTDAYVVQPLFFPGGDIGCLSVYGTVNDLAMCGARPRYLSVSLILEEGLEIRQLQEILFSIKAAAERCDVQLVTGDTKVIERGRGDGLYITTAGVGEILSPQPVIPQHIQPGDSILISGPVGAHGMAIMSQREGLAFDSPIVSDCAPLHGLVLDLLSAGIRLHCLRDATRGGLASSLNELAQQAGLGMMLEEACIPVEPTVAAACEILGFDPLYVANEGVMVLCLPEAEAEAALSCLRQHPLGQQACCIGRVQAQAGPVVLRNTLNTTRVLDLLSGEQLPRIC